MRSCCAGTTHSGASIRVAIVHNFLRGPDAVSADGCFRGSGQRAPREVAENRHGGRRPISTCSLLTRRLADAFNRFGLELDINPAAQTAVDQGDEIDAAVGNVEEFQRLRCTTRDEGRVTPAKQAAQPR